MKGKYLKIFFLLFPSPCNPPTPILFENCEYRLSIRKEKSTENRENLGNSRNVRNIESIRENEESDFICLIESFYLGIWALGEIFYRPN